MTCPECKGKGFIPNILSDFLIVAVPIIGPIASCFMYDKKRCKVCCGTGTIGGSGCVSEEPQKARRL